MVLFILFIDHIDQIVYRDFFHYIWPQGLQYYYEAPHAFSNEIIKVIFEEDARDGD